MTEQKPTRGGARPNAGAPLKADKAKNRTVRLSDAEYIKFKELGGARWLKMKLNEEPAV